MIKPTLLGSSFIFESLEEDLTFVEDMFSTGHDEANRATVAVRKPDNLPIVGLALREERKLVDKITKGAKMHP